MLLIAVPEIIRTPLEGEVLRKYLGETVRGRLADQAQFLTPKSTSLRAVLTHGTNHSAGRRWVMKHWALQKK